MLLLLTRGGRGGGRAVAAAAAAAAVGRSRRKGHAGGELGDLSIEPTDVATHEGVPMVLDMVVGAPGQTLGDFTPFVAYLAVEGRREGERKGGSVSLCEMVYIHTTRAKATRTKHVHIDAHSTRGRERGREGWMNGANVPVGIRHDLLLLFRPRVLVDVGVQVIVPPLPALLPRPPRDAQRCVCRDRE